MLYPMERICNRMVASINVYLFIDVLGKNGDINTAFNFDELLSLPMNSLNMTARI